MNDINGAVIRSWFADGFDFQVAHGNEADAIVKGVESGGIESPHKSRHASLFIDKRQLWTIRISSTRLWTTNDNRYFSYTGKKIIYRLCNYNYHLLRISCAQAPIRIIP